MITFLEYLNQSHPTIKITAQFRTNGEQKNISWCGESSTLIVKTEALKEGVLNNSVDFLDTTLWVDPQGKIQSDLFVKDCAKITYLLPSSCHAGHVSKNIPYSLGYRLKRICSVPETFQRRLAELKTNLLARRYKERVIDDAFKRLGGISREEALK